MNPNAMLDTVERISSLADEMHWEVKTQCLEFAAAILSKFKDNAHLMAAKDDLKAGKTSSPPAHQSHQLNGKSGHNSNQQVDKTTIKNAL